MHFQQILFSIFMVHSYLISLKIIKENQKHQTSEIENQKKMD